MASYPYTRIFIKGKRVDEHRYLMEQKVGRKLSFNEVVHHKDGNKKNNAIGNLELINRGDHQRIHRIGYRHKASTIAKIREKRHLTISIKQKGRSAVPVHKRQKTQRMNKITAFERDSETLYLKDEAGNDIDIPMDEFESFVRTHGKLLQVMVEHDDSVTYHEHTYHIELPEYFDSLSDFKVLIDINQFMDLRESVAAFDIKPVLDRILSTYHP